MARRLDASSAGTHCGTQHYTNPSHSICTNVANFSNFVTPVTSIPLRRLSSIACAIRPSSASCDTDQLSCLAPHTRTVIWPPPGQAVRPCPRATPRGERQRSWLMPARFLVSPQKGRSRAPRLLVLPPHGISLVTGAAPSADIRLHHVGYRGHRDFERCLDFHSSECPCGPREWTPIRFRNLEASDTR